jgi:hypothetical protein
MSTWDPNEHTVWGYLIGGKWHPTVDKDSAEKLVESNPKRILGKRTLSAVEEVKEPKKE